MLYLALLTLIMVFTFCYKFVLFTTKINEIKKKKKKKKKKQKKRLILLLLVQMIQTNYDPDQTSKGGVWSGTLLYTQAYLS